ncbi:MAG TPA: anthrone oxygenase family protein [Bryobacteraceae bacterium]
MNDKFLFGLTLCSVLGSGLMAGVFFAFSTFVMNALSRLPEPQGMAAMQSINIVAVTPAFMTALFGTAATCGILAVVSLFTWHTRGSGYLLAGSLSYLIGAILVTVLFNMPLNERLAVTTPASAESATFWASYLTRWTTWNHIGAIAALGATALLIVALCLQVFGHREDAN